MTDAAPPPILWQPSAARIEHARVSQFMRWLKTERERDFATYDALWQWSVSDLEGFWATLWDWSGFIAAQPWKRVLGAREMPGAQWFPGARLNYVDQIFRHETAARPAILSRGETGALRRTSWRDLREKVADVAAHLRRAGIRPGDRVAAFATNTPETIIAFLATASLGAIWSVCSLDMGVQSVLDRFRQIEPSFLFVQTSSSYNGKHVDRAEQAQTIIDALPSLREIVELPGDGPMAPSNGKRTAWGDIPRTGGELGTEPVAFDHPLWILYSSGTTGLPKAIVHGHGGMILESAILGLHNDLGPSDVFHWYSTTGWVMWNCQIAALLGGSTIAIYDGSPSWPDFGALWSFAAEAGVTTFGAGAAFYASCLKSEVRPRMRGDLSALRSIGSTGSPLSSDCYDWIYRELGPDVWLAPMSGGTDIAGPFVAGVPILPVHAGEMQCRVLGADVRAFDEAGASITDDVGELVCTTPLPAMPVFFWNDPDGSRYRASYFDTYPGVWRHGDWVSITPRGGAVIHGRSDATINRHGLRLGTAEIYRAIEALPDVLDSLIIDLEYLGRPSWMALFVQLREGQARDGIVLDAGLSEKIRAAIRASVSARFIPDAMYQVASVPRTLTGKKLEVPVKKLLLGQDAAKVVNRDAMANPDSIDWFITFAEQRAAEAPA